MPRNGGKHGRAKPCRGGSGLQSAAVNGVRRTISRSPLEGEQDRPSRSEGGSGAGDFEGDSKTPLPERRCIARAMRRSCPPPQGGREIETYGRIYNYSADAGAGSQLITNISESPGWRAALLGTVAAGSLWLYSARVARADCAADGPTILNCTDTIAGNVAPGVVNGGILVPDTYTTLNVYDLDANVAPDAGVDGIYFHRTGAGNAIVINSNTNPFDIIVTGVGADGIDAMSDAAITINHLGDIDASLGSYGIRATVSASGTGPLYIAATGEITANTRGIHAFNNGTGAVTIIANGDVQAIGAFSTGIYARNLNAAGTGGITISAESVSGTLLGIDARNFSTGALEITAYGDVAGTGANSTGIYARQSNAGTGPVSVTTEGVTGGIYGIFARNYGTGALSIVANGDVGDRMGIIPSITGIYAFNSPNSDYGITIEANDDVTGGQTAIHARNYGTGALSITAHGEVEGRFDTGIFAFNTAGLDDGTSLSIVTEAKVTGGRNGIDARNYALGAMTIVAEGDVEGTAITGIYALHSNATATGPLSITTEGVTGGAYGISARNYGSGALEIVANGDVMGTSDFGIFALNSAASTGPLNITSEGTVTGGTYGIRAFNFWRRRA